MAVRIIQGDALTVLKTLPDASVQMVCTSPPYFGLRDYETATWDGGDPACDHKHDTAHQKQGATSARAGRNNVDVQRNENFRGICQKCGAARIDHQIGLEATPEAYIAALVGVFREVRRVLRADGTVWLNLGDSYNNFRTQMGPGQALHGRDKLHGKPEPLSGGRGWSGLKEKDLLQMPSRVAQALQAPTHQPVPCVVLDCFGGAGTTGLAPRPRCNPNRVEREVRRHGREAHHQRCTIVHPG